MRALRFLAVLAAVAAPASCSLITSYAGLGSGGAGGDATTGATTITAGGSGAASGGASQGGGGTAGSAASGGGTGGDPGLDAGPDASDLCTPGDLYCGGHLVKGDANTLYACKGDHSVTVAEVCKHGCTTRPTGDDDLCACEAGGFYCGGDHILGDADTLYKCKANGGPTGTLVRHCPHGCEVNPGDDDACKP